MFVSHAQNFEDVLLWRALRDIDRGAYLDIGAHDPIVESVSYAFYRAGWRGMHVEPIPFYAARLRELRPDEHVIEAAVSDAAGPITFYELSGLSTGRQDIAHHHAEQGHQSREMLVPTVRLADLLERGPEQLHWLKIDVEGMEADVLRSWGDCPRRPWVLVIESTYPNSQEQQQHLWIKEVLDREYEEAFFDGLSRYFVHSAHKVLKSAFLTPANVFDDFTIPRTHFAARELRDELDGAKRLLDTQRALVEALEEGASRDAEELEAAQSRALALALRIEELQLSAARDAEQLRTAEELRIRAGRTEARLSASRAVIARLHERNTSLQERFAIAARTIEQLAQDLRHAGNEQAAARAEVARLEERTASLQQQEQRLRSRHAAQLAAVQRLIKAARQVRPGRWERLGVRLGLARPSTALDPLTAWATTNGGRIAAAGGGETSNIEGPSASWSESMLGERNPYLRADSLNALLDWDDVDFVRCAYVTVLGRQPDPAGEAHFVRHLRRGVSKLKVLWQLRTAPEARRHDPGIAGFDRALRRARLGRLPIVGGLFRALYHVEGDSSSERAIRIVANEVARLRGEQATQSAQLGALAGSLARIQSALEQRTVSGEALPDIPRAPSLTDPIHLTSDRGEDMLREVASAVNASAEAASIRSTTSKQTNS